MENSNCICVTHTAKYLCRFYDNGTGGCDKSKTMIPISEYPLIKNQFNAVFKVPFSNFYENDLSIACGYVVIDFLKFNEWLQTQFGQYHGSLNSKVISEFGLEAKKLLDKIL